MLDLAGLTRRYGEIIVTLANVSRIFIVFAVFFKLEKAGFERVKEAGSRRSYLWRFIDSSLFI